ncbi:MAG: rRNA maturation RNase YbeY [Planctomycetaceae bacterium]|jgi:probable rRNA maturation factor|nr:rRNA maturation RNase YbeY [Planctomycetaceae bacterium]
MKLLTIDIIDSQKLLDRFGGDIKYKRQIIATLKSICKQILDDADIRFGYLNIAIVDGTTMRKYNVEFLGHDYVTDVISFPVDYKEENYKNGQTKKYIEGDILVCADMAFERASEFNWSPLEELFLYTIHGTLHLAGYDDKNKNAKKRMKKKETEYINITKNRADNLFQIQ